MQDNIDLVNGDNTFNYYTDFVKRALENDAVYSNFKSNFDYNRILEHVSPEQGVVYLEKILERYAQEIPVDLWYSFLENDKIGGPKKVNYKNKTMSIDISPTTLRYIYYAFDIIDTMKFDNDKGINIVEVGPGYGGLCKIFLDVANFRGLKVNSYVGFDLEYPSKLMNKYMADVNHKKCFINCVTIDSYIPDTPIDLFISCYAYSELSIKYRRTYKNLLTKCANGYIVWNSRENLEEIKQDIDKQNVSVKPEVPLTGQFNKIAYWKE